MGASRESRSALEDPSSLLEAAFRRIQSERMADVPMLNPALRVEAVGFSRWQGEWLGVLITPWFMNLVLVPASEKASSGAREGERIYHPFAAGMFAFLSGCEPELGEYQACSLFSPMGGFVDQASARAVAHAALKLLHSAPGASQAASAREAARNGTPPGIPKLAMSKREFLHRLFMRAPAR